MDTKEGNIQGARHRYLSDPQYRMQIDDEVIRDLSDFKRKIDLKAIDLLREMKLYGHVTITNMFDQTKLAILPPEDISYKPKEK